MGKAKSCKWLLKDNINNILCRFEKVKKKDSLAVCEL